MRVGRFVGRSRSRLRPSNSRGWYSVATGQIVTFYSYKGGVGRSFALANVAALLSNWGYRVLCVDWDLEAPGLSYYFPAPAQQVGLLEMVESAVRGEVPGALAHVVQVQTGNSATVDLLGAGRQDASYAARLQALDWERAYVDHNLARVLEDWRADWMRTYDIILVDSRTGISDS